jgi:hypothetical protein
VRGGRTREMCEGGKGTRVADGGNIPEPDGRKGFRVSDSGRNTPEPDDGKGFRFSGFQMGATLLNPTTENKPTPPRSRTSKSRAARM